ncbi:MAG: D-alanyl-D-alanine carboxypeptidase/D-alanyl-D-alanine-endopeptidase [Bacteroidales bacterium]|nr:D-alanyl-D-alanine carboxypeptidase/D-alanyl-D-alanine-endopeptidase [Bacteroidales bacterium]
MQRFLVLTAFLVFHHLNGIHSQSVAQRLDQLLQSSPLLQTSDAGIIVYDLADERVVFEHQADHLYRPASVQKLLTSITAMSVLGPDYCMDTSWSLRGDTLVFKGGFDPFFTESDLDSLLLTIPQHRHVRADVSMMDSVYWGKGWCWDDAPDSFQPYLSPLMLNGGCVGIEVSPTSADSLAFVRSYPFSPMYSIANHVVTRLGCRNDLRITRNWMQQGNDIQVSGVVSKPQTLSISIFPSDEFFMSVASHKLMWSCIDNNITSRSIHRPITDVVSKTLKESDNLGAEALFYHLASHQARCAHVGSSDGIEAINGFIRDTLRLDPSHYCVVDGCGLSNYNRVSARLILAFLRYAHAHIPDYASYLPVAGVDGTLKNRMNSKNLRGKVLAKTGSMSGVSSLAGYLTTANKHTLAFVVLNQNVLSLQDARRFQDELIRLLYGNDNLKR